MSVAETMIWMAGAAVLWAGMALIAMRFIERPKRRKTDEH